MLGSLSVGASYAFGILRFISLTGTGFTSFLALTENLWTLSWVLCITTGALSI